MSRRCAAGVRAVKNSNVRRLSTGQYANTLAGWISLPGRKRPNGKKQAAPARPTIEKTPPKTKPGKEEATPPQPKAPAVTAARTSQFESGFPVVGIGASAGGLEAMEEFFDNMPPETGMAFVVVTHQHPGHTSLLPELLGRQTGMKVIEAKDNTKVEPNHVYVGAPAGYLTMVGGRLRTVETAGNEVPRLPIDYFFRSLANDQKERAICIVLSGTGTDGTLGLKAIKSESGMSMAQSPDSAKYSGMPVSAIDTGLADYVLSARDMPRQLIAYAKGPYMTAVSAISEAPTMDNEMPKIFALLRAPNGERFLGRQEQHYPPPDRTADEPASNQEADRVCQIPAGTSA
jgi:two-component system, chemotaxis family, CheB/CheR fusion protein